MRAYHVHASVPYPALAVASGTPLSFNRTLTGRNEAIAMMRAAAKALDFNYGQFVARVDEVCGDSVRTIARAES